MNELVELKERFEGIVQSTEKFPVDFDEAWRWVGYGRKDYALDALKANFQEGMDYSSILMNKSYEKLDSGLNRNQDHKSGWGGDRRSINYFLTADCFKAFCMMAGTSKGKEVRLYYLKIEKAWNTPEAVMARAQQMGATLNWKEPSAAKMVVQLRAYNQGLMTPNEYRRKVLNLPPFEIDAPLERPRKEARKTKTEPEEKYYPSDELLKFVDNNLDFTSSSDDFIRLADLYDRYVLQVKTPLSRWTFIHTLKGSFNIISRQKKIGGYPSLVFIGCKFKPFKE